MINARRFDHPGPYVYLESQQEVDAFLETLKDELDEAIQASKRIRLR